MARYVAVRCYLASSCKAKVPPLWNLARFAREMVEGTSTKLGDGENPSWIGTGKLIKIAEAFLHLSLGAAAHKLC